MPSLSDANSVPSPTSIAPAETGVSQSLAPAESAESYTPQSIASPSIANARVSDAQGGGQDRGLDDGDGFDDGHGDAVVDQAGAD